MDPTYSTSLAILKRIFLLEIARLQTPGERVPEGQQGDA
jgi:hypothetical protein